MPSTTRATGSPEVIELDPEVASILGSTVTAIYSPDNESMCLVMDNGRVITFEGTFEIFMNERTIQ